MVSYTPALALRPYVRSILVLESLSGMDNHVVPDTAVVLALRFAGCVRSDGVALPPFVLSGLRKSGRVLTYEPGTGTVLVLFREGGARHFFPLPLHELFGVSEDLGAFVPASGLTRLTDELAGDPVAVVERFLLDRLSPSAGDPLVAAAVQRIRATGGETRIETLLRDIPLSRDPFEKRFRQAIGATPKQFSRIVRFRNLIGQRPRGLTQVAYDAGYFDQAHFIKDFRIFTGKTPGAFFSGPAFW